MSVWLYQQECCQLQNLTSVFTYTEGFSYFGRSPQVKVSHGIMDWAAVKQWLSVVFKNEVFISYQ